MGYRRATFTEENANWIMQILTVKNCSGCIGLEEGVGRDHATKMDKINALHLH